MHYCTVTLPVHLFLTMKSPELAQIWILKLPPTSRPNCGIIQHVVIYVQACSNSAYPQHSGERYRTSGPLGWFLLTWFLLTCFNG